jgi:hypothetical protein
MDATHLRAYVILPTLKALDLWSPAAETLLVGTAAHESAMGKYLHQVRGPALGIYQIEPITHFDVWANFLKYKTGLRDKVLGMIPQNMLRHDSATGINYGAESMLMTDLAYATVIARLLYLRIPAPAPDNTHLPFPADGDIDGMAAYWKRYYNTPKGAGTVGEFKAHYAQYAG